MPVMVFSHGNSSLAEQSYYLTEYFASHGWVVIAPNHTHNTVSDSPGAINYHSALTRPQDITAVLDWLDAVPQDHFLHGRTTDQIVLSGHSFGGYTTLASAGATFAVDSLIERCERQEIDARLCEVFSAEADLRPRLQRPTRQARHLAHPGRRGLLSRRRRPDRRAHPHHDRRARSLLAQRRGG